MQRSKLWAGLVALVVVAISAVAVYFAYASRDNRVSAAAWRERAEALDRTLTARGRQLNERTEALNSTTSRLDRSEADVRTLERRQRQLANEKAEVEDAQGILQVQASQLTAIAEQQRECSTGLSLVLSHFANEDYAWVNVNIGGIAATCQQASDDFAAFEAQTGG